MKPTLLVSVHCYSGDRHQVEMLLPVFEHHGVPVVVVSPVDSQVHNIGPHHTRCAGEVQYYGQKSWDRQHAQLKLLLEYSEIEWFLLNDADSFCFAPELPEYLFENKNMVYSNEVDDFRTRGGTWANADGSITTFPLDYHAGHDKLIAMQPPYFCSRKALQLIVNASEGMVACPITPFIDWWWVPACKLADVNHLPFRNCVSCETETEMGLRLVGDRVRDGAIFIHAVKRQHAFDTLAEIYRATLK